MTGVRRDVEPFLGEILIVAFNFAPRGWASCNGQLLAINQNQALFSVLGTTYGGNGTTTFALPDFRGRSPIHWGDSTTLGEKSGEENHTLILSEIPQHGHVLSLPMSQIRGAGTQVVGLQKVGVTGSSDTITVAPSGSSQPHNNMPPYLVLNFIIALQGIYPSRS